jgi:hypothetical protein
MPGMVAAMGTVAEQIVSEAQAAAPVLTGEYRDSIHVEGNRAVASDWKSVYIEFGTGYPGPTPAFAPMRGAMESVHI